MFRTLLVISVFVLVGADAKGETTTEADLKSSVKLTCPVNIEQHEFPQWYKSADPSSSGVGKEVEIYFTPEKYDFPDISSLVIKNIETKDEGKYHCKIAFTNDVRRTFRISIAKKKDEFETTISPLEVQKPEWTNIPYPEVTVDSSRFIVIQCKASGDDVTVSVYRINEVNSSMKDKLKEPTLIIHRPKQSDAGKYKCVAENKAGKIEHDFEIVVRQNGEWSEWSSWSKCDVECGYGLHERKRECNNPPPSGGGRICYGRTMDQQRCRERSCQFPKVTKFGFEITDDALILSCAGKGLPQPTAEWKYSNILLDETSQNGELKIPKSRAKSGFYRCKLSNQAGFFTISFEITDI